MTNDTFESEKMKARCYVSWITKEKIQELLNFLRLGHSPLSGVALSQTFERVVRLTIGDAYERGLANPNDDGRWPNNRVFQIASQLAFLDLLKNGTILAFGQSGSLEWTPPPGYWNFVQLKDIDFERSIFFPSDPARTVYGVMILPAPKAVAENSGTDESALVYKPDLPTNRRYAEATVRKWYKDRVKTWPTSQAGPSRQQDEKAAQAQFPGISRTMARNLRKELAPEAWKNTGKRQR